MSAYCHYRSRITKSEPRSEEGQANRLNRMPSTFCKPSVIKLI
ncbi:hypothetical protein F383_34983 [Gossypium arboreum]|uniref:Uncharacterized protein n=1 Tax=Gossypium arboreum TaxID=29729 RepID=A0A0B0PTR1_GOSAR|nr:hypothetical protein F383_34983 [Gossypium arboreum]